MAFLVYHQATLSRRGSSSSRSRARHFCRCTVSRDGLRAEKYSAVCSACWTRFMRVLSACPPRMRALVLRLCG